MQRFGPNGWYLFGYFLLIRVCKNDPDGLDYDKISARYIHIQINPSLLKPYFKLMFTIKNLIISLLEIRNLLHENLERLAG